MKTRRIEITEEQLERLLAFILHPVPGNDHWIEGAGSPVPRGIAKEPAALWDPSRTRHPVG
jgi:hypothetical protein